MIKNEQPELEIDSVSTEGEVKIVFSQNMLSVEPDLEVISKYLDITLET